MAGVSTRDIKNRIKSMESTRQITKAMEMVAASKLRQAQNRITASRPYFEILSDTIAQIAGANRDFSSPYLCAPQAGRTLYVVIAGDRGLAGGYNNNVLRLALSRMEGEDAAVLPIGKRCVDFFRGKGCAILTDAYAEAAAVDIGDCFRIAKLLSQAYLTGKYSRIQIVYTEFVSVLSQSPAQRQLLPLVPDKTFSQRTGTEYDPDSETVFAAIVPEYLGGVIYGALCESLCAEQAARRTAMDAATSNAEEMIADLRLKYNRARQSAITSEIIDIIAGSGA